jgi:hypothetical protein
MFITVPALLLLCTCVRPDYAVKHLSILCMATVWGAPEDGTETPGALCLQHGRMNPGAQWQ